MNEQENHLIIDPEQLSRPIRWERLFGRAGPVHIDMGCGKGAFLLNLARSRPELNILGIEYANKYFRFAADRLRRWGVENVRVIRIDGRDFIRYYVPDESVQCFHIYFPDPWPKRRHHKRRFFNQQNLQQLYRILQPGGELRTITDHAEYARIIEELLDGHGGFERIEFLPHAADSNEWVGTNFERKYAREGRRFFPLAVRKIPA